MRGSVEARRAKGASPGPGRRRAGALAALLAASLGPLVARVALSRPLPAATEAWRKVEAGRVTVVGTASDRKLVETAVTLRALLVVLPQLVPGSFRAVPPLVVAVPHDPAHLARVGFPAVELTGRIVLVSGGDEDARPGLLRAATAALVTRAVPPPPPWLAAGLVEYVSTFTATEARATFGRIVPEHVARLRSLHVGASRPALFSAPSFAGDGEDDALLRAEAWAVVHDLLHGTPDGGERLGRLVALLAEGRDGPSAAREAFGEDERDLLARARAHAVESRPLARTVAVPPSVPPPGRVLPLTRAGAARALGGIARGRSALPSEAPVPPGSAAGPVPAPAPLRPPGPVTRDVPAEVDRVNVLLDEGREEEALARLEALHASLGNDPEMQRALGLDVAEVRRVVVHNRLVRRYNEAIGLLNAGRRGEAIPVFREVAAAAEDPELRRLAWERATAPDSRGR